MKVAYLSSDFEVFVVCCPVRLMCLFDQHFVDATLPFASMRAVGDGLLCSLVDSCCYLFLICS